MSALDDILNVGVPVLLIIIVLGFLWVKFIEPWVVPMFARLWDKMANRQQEVKHGKDIIYE